MTENEIKLTEQLSAATSTIEKMQVQMDSLQRRIDWFEKQFFGQKSEKTSVVLNQDGEQMRLFNEVEATATNQTDKGTVTVPEHVRKAKRTKDEIFADLEKQDIIHHLENLICDVCGSEMVVIGKELIREELVFERARMYIRRHFAETAKCVHCGSDESKDAELPEIASCVFKKADTPKPLLPRSFVSAELLAHIIYEKYKKAVPLYRLETDFKAMGCTITRATMANWVNWAATEKFSAVYDLMKADLLAGKVIHTDETVVQVLKEPGRKPKTKSRMWVYCAGKESGKNDVVFEYQPTRGGRHAVEFLGDFSGYSMTDDYSGYNRLKKAKRCLCWTHTRRYFIKALPTDPELLPTSQAAVGVEWCNKIYELEREYEGRPAEERLKNRQERIKPVLDEFFSWANNLNVAAGTELAKAIGYLVTNRALLCTFLEDPDVPLDNNRAESAIRPFVVGRKNWLFSDTTKGAEASAILYSIVSTAAANGLDVEQYLVDLLKSDTPLLPWKD